MENQELSSPTDEAFQELKKNIELLETAISELELRLGYILRTHDTVRDEGENSKVEVNLSSPLVKEVYSLSSKIDQSQVRLITLLQDIEI